jgi:hypothetical protein
VMEVDASGLVKVEFAMMEFDVVDKLLEGVVVFPSLWSSSGSGSSP